MIRFTSGFSVDEDGNQIFLINTKYYHIQDDQTCFWMSCACRGLKNLYINDLYKIQRANITKRQCDDPMGVWIDFDVTGKEEFRVYKVQNKNGENNENHKYNAKGCG